MGFKYYILGPSGRCATLGIRLGYLGSARPARGVSPADLGRVC